MSQHVGEETFSVALSEIEVPIRIRKTDPMKVAELSRSIEVDGLLQPIGVRKGQAKPYSLVFGGHRLASHQKLARATIEARLLDIRDEEFESAMLAENLYRHPLSAVDAARSLKRWREIHAARFPLTVGKASQSAGLAKGRKTIADRVAKNGDDSLSSPSEPVMEPAPPAAADEPFIRTAAATLNVSERTLDRDDKVARILSHADLDILQGIGVTKTDLRRLADVADDEQRRAAVTLAAAGMKVEVAIVAAGSPANATVEHADAEDSGIKPEAEMDDDEWLEHYCKDALARLSYQVTFRKDAIIWRQTSPHLGKLRKKTKKALARSKSYKPGPFHYRLASLLDVLHPNDWPKCAPCNGTANLGSTSQCSKCHGTGFSVAIGWPK